MISLKHPVSVTSPKVLSIEESIIRIISPMRLFIGLFPPSEIQRQVFERIQQVGVSGRVRRIPQKQLHLTVQFLGETEESVLPRLEGALRRGVVGAGPLRLHFEGGGAFPERKKPRVLWLGVHGEISGLLTLAGRVWQATAECGFKLEQRRFSPHLTVGRIGPDDRIDPSPFEEGINGFRSDFFTVQSIQIVQSKTGPTGSEYVVLKSIPLI